MEQTRKEYRHELEIVQEKVAVMGDRACAEVQMAMEALYWSRKIVTRKAITSVSEKASNHY